ncbi:hypothetical protein L7F22_021257 [Adiantum nelumboides]|nr:hypothetical protein [Adiantum nelumboides]
MPAELDGITRAVLRLEIEETGLAQEDDPASRGPARPAPCRAERPAGPGRRDAGPVGGRAAGHPAGPGAAGRPGAGPPRGRGGRARLRPEPGRRAALRRARRPGAAPAVGGGAADRQAGGAPVAARGGHDRRDRRDRLAVDRHPDRPAHRGEREKLLRLDEVLHERVVGQDEAVQAVADALIRARSGVKDPRRPSGSFLFLGPTGVGKTELARSLARRCSTPRTTSSGWT